MAYDNDFYEMYEQYLNEPTVRENHATAFRLFHKVLDSLYYTRSVRNVIDLGCGLGEFKRYAQGAINYLGIDKNPGPHTNLVTDYTKPLLLKKEFTPNIFVSLFSIEACLPAHERYEIYTRMFRDFPTLEGALVSGFYYQHAADQDMINETGDITSFQTVEPLERFQSESFNEMRILMHTPSKMFGQDVVEVWKILTRKTSKWMSPT